MPSVSDPGYRLVAAAVERDVPVTAVPGPVRGADRAGGERAAGRPVLLRGLPAPQGGRALAPARRAGRRRSARWSSSRRRTAPRPRWPRWPRRSATTGPAAVCRELTKTHEEVRRGPLADLVDLGRRGRTRRGDHRRRRAPTPAAAIDRPGQPARRGRRARGRRHDPQGRDRRGGPAGRGAQARGLRPGARGQAGHERAHRAIEPRRAWSSTSATTGPLDGDPVVLLHGFPERGSSLARGRAAAARARAAHLRARPARLLAGRAPAAARALPHATTSSTTSSR